MHAARRFGRARNLHQSWKNLHETAGNSPREVADPISEHTSRSNRNNVVEIFGRAAKRNEGCLVHASLGPEQSFADLDDRSFCLQQLANLCVHGSACEQAGPLWCVEAAHKKEWRL